MALFQVFDGLNGVSGGILRARGKQVCFLHVSFAQSGLDICGIVNWRSIEFKVCLPLRYIFLANCDIYLAPTMRLVSCPHFLLNQLGFDRCPEQVFPSESGWRSDVTWGSMDCGMA